MKVVVDMNLSPEWVDFLEREGAEDLLPESIGADVVEALSDQEDLLRQGALIVIDETSRRVRILPLPR